MLSLLFVANTFLFPQESGLLRRQLQPLIDAARAEMQTHCAVQLHGLSEGVVTAGGIVPLPWSFTLLCDDVQRRVEVSAVPLTGSDAVSLDMPASTPASPALHFAAPVSVRGTSRPDAMRAALLAARRIKVPERMAPMPTNTQTEAAATSDIFTALLQAQPAHAYGLPREAQGAWLGRLSSVVPSELEGRLNEPTPPPVFTAQGQQEPPARTPWLGLSAPAFSNDRNFAAVLMARIDDPDAGCVLTVFEIAVLRRERSGWRVYVTIKTGSSHALTQDH